MKSALNLGGRQLGLSTPVVMGIINVTPDSFYDGATLGSISKAGFAPDLDLCMIRAESMVDAGAAILDIGGESTRPGADRISAQEQLQRVIPVIEAIKANLDTAVSIDTSSPEVIKEATAAGAELVNDIRALQEPGALAAASASGVAVCLMHTLGEPGVMQQDVHYENAVEEIFQFLRERVDQAIEAGIGRDRLIIDPGFGFGKKLTHNYDLLRNLKRFAELNIPLLVGLSRKSMIGNVVERAPEDRLAGSLAATTLALLQGANIIRTHDVAETVDVVKITCAHAHGV